MTTKLNTTLLDISIVPFYAKKKLKYSTTPSIYLSSSQPMLSSLIFRINYSYTYIMPTLWASIRETYTVHLMHYLYYLWHQECSSAPQQLCHLSQQKNQNKNCNNNNKCWKKKKKKEKGKQQQLMKIAIKA